MFDQWGSGYQAGRLAPTPQVPSARSLKDDILVAAASFTLMPGAFGGVVSTRERQPLISHCFAGFRHAVLAGHGLDVFHLVRVQVVAKRPRITQPAWGDTKADVLGEERGGNADREEGDIVASAVSVGGVRWCDVLRVIE